MEEHPDSTALNPPRLAKLAHESLHPRNVQTEDWEHSAIPMGSDRVVHKRSVFCLVEEFVRADRAPPEILSIVRGVVKDDPADISIVAGAAF